MCIILTAFGVNSLRELGVRHHLLPLGKQLNVKCRSMSKYDMLVPLAKKLVELEHIHVNTHVNYRDLKRDDVTAVISAHDLLKRSPKETVLVSCAAIDDNDDGASSTASTVICDSDDYN